MQAATRMAMTVSILGAVVGVFPTADGSAAVTIATNDAAQVTEFSAQRRRARPRIRIYAPYAYPGPHAVRHCTSWLEPEWRPSGTVIVPRMHCWWVRG